MAESTIGKVIAEFVGDASSLVRESAKAEKALDNFDKKVRETGSGPDPFIKPALSLKAFGDTAVKVGQRMSLAITAPMVATGAAAIKLANNFEQSMSSITALVGLSAKQVDGMSGAVRKMAINLGGSANDAANALYFVASAGIDASTAMEVVDSSLKASAVGMGQTAVIADAVSSALNAYGKANLSAAEATDLMVASVREGKMEADALAGALPRVLPIASAMSVSFQEVGAAFAAMSRNGTDANEAATQIRGILSALLNPTKQAEEQLAALGLSSSGLRKSIKEDGLLATLKILNDSFGQNEEAAGVVFGNIRALTGVMSLFGTASDSTAQIFSRLQDNTGVLNKAFETMSNTGAFKVSQATAQLKDSMISLGQALIPVVLPILKTVTNALAGMARALNALPGFLKYAVVGFGLLVAAAGPMLVALGMVAKAITAIREASLMAAGAQGVGALTAGFKTMLGMFTNPYFLGAAAVIGTLGLAFKVMSDNSREAEERQKRLNDQLVAANDPTATLVENVTALGKAYAEAAAESNALAPAAMGANEIFLAGEIAAKGLDTAFANTGISISDLTKVVATGSNEFDAFASRLKQNANGVSGYKDILDQAVQAGMPFAESLRAAYEAGALTGPQLANLVDIIDKSADAFDDQAEANNKAAQALLTGGDSYNRYNAILGEGFIRIRDNAVATAQAAGSQYAYSDALAVVEDTVARVEYVQARLNGTTAETRNTVRSTVPAVRNLDDVLRGLRASNEEGQASFTSLAQAVGIAGDVLANNLRLALMDTSDKAVALFNDLADGETTFLDVERAVRQSANQIGELVVQTTNLGGKTSDAIPQIIEIMRALYDGAEAAGVSRSAVTGLIKEIGFLDKLSPEIALALTLDTTAIEAQIQQLVSRLQASGGRSGALISQIEDLSALLAAVRGTEKRRGGGGGGGGDKKKPFDWVEGWLKDISDFVKGVFAKDFRNKLLSGTSEEIADAIDKMLEKAFELGIDKLDKSGTLGAVVRSLSSQLQGLADQLNAPGGLQEQFDAATRKVDEFTRELETLQAAADDFHRTEVLGQYNVNELLDQGLAKYAEMKSSLASLIAEYEQFSAPKTNLEIQLDRLGQLGDALQSLKDSYAEIAKLDEPLSPLEQQRSALMDLKSAYENLAKARTDYAQSTAESMSRFEFKARGGALTQAKAYLAKAGAFKAILASLRDRAFPANMIREVVAAGVDGGTALGRKLLALSDADLGELKQVQAQINAMAAETGQIAADVLFTADVSDAQAAFKEQLSLVQGMYQSALAQSQAEFDQQQQVVAGVYQQQIAAAQQALEQQKIVVEGLYQDALSLAKKNLAEAKSVADGLKTSIDNLKTVMAQLIDAIAKAVEAASKGQQPSQGGGGGGGGFVSPPLSSDYAQTPLGNYLKMPGSDWQLVHNTPFGDYIETSPGQFQGVDLAPWTTMVGLHGRAAGGPVVGNKPYMVGEVGPELFVPNRSGSIVPNNALPMVASGGPSTYNITVNARGDATEVGRQVVRAIQEYERRNGTAWRN